MKKNKHGGKRIPGPGKRLGRNPSPLPSFLKRFRATDEEREEFKAYLSGDASRDFKIILEALRVSEGAGLKPQQKGKG